MHPLYNQQIHRKFELEVRSSEIYGRKIPLLELREKLLIKQEKYMRICNASITDEELLQLALSVGYRLSPSMGVENAIAELETYKATRNLAIWHDHSTILRTGYILFAVWIVYDPSHRGRVHCSIRSVYFKFARDN